MRSRSDRSQFRSQSWWVCACAMAALLLALTAAGLAGESEAVVLVDFNGSQMMTNFAQRRRRTPTEPSSRCISSHSLHLMARNP